MSVKFSSAYRRATDANGLTFSYEGVNAERRGQVCVRFATFTGTIGSGESLRLAGGFLQGERILRARILADGDPDVGNDFTFNLGWRVGTAASPATAFASASTGLQATSVADFVPAISTQGAAEGDDLVLAQAAGAAEVSRTYTIVIESYMP